MRKHYFVKRFADALYVHDGGIVFAYVFNARMQNKSRWFV
jgi:hypothetical protein